LDSFSTEISRRLSSVNADDEGLESILEGVRAHLGMDVVFVSEFADGRQVFRALGGDAQSFGLELNDGPPLETTYCQLLIDGLIPGVLPDASADDRVRDLAATVDGPIGSYVGVPLRFKDGRTYGTFCCLSHEPDSRLDDRDVAFMRLLGDVLAERLEARENRRRIRGQVQQTLSGDGITMALQPIVASSDGEWIGAEALARFPSLGVAPDVMFGRAHQSGLGTELELMAVRAALRLLPQLPDGVYLSVNVGPAGMLAPAFPDTLRSCGDLDRLVVEITEHASIEEYDDLARVLASLRRDGLRLAVDDVGAGYASLRHVLRMQPDLIKVDRSLVRGIATDVARRSIVTSIALLSLDLGASIVAEGVETAADAATLADLGAESLQGYHFARPSTDRYEWATWQRQWTSGRATPGQRITSDI